MDHGPPILLLPFLAGSSTKSSLAFASVRFLLRATRPSSVRAAGRCSVAAPLFRLPGLPLSPCFFYEPPAAGRRAPEPQPWSPVCHLHHGPSRNRGPPRAGASHGRRRHSHDRSSSRGPPAAARPSRSHGRRFVIFTMVLLGTAGRRAPEPQPRSTEEQSRPQLGVVTGMVPVASPHSNMIHKFFSLKLYKIRILFLESDFYIF